MGIEKEAAGMEQVNKDNKILAILAAVLIVAVLIIAILMIRQMGEINELSGQIEGAFRQIAGAAEGNEDVVHAIVDGMKNELDQDLIERGESVLSQYGYHDNISTVYDMLVKDYQRENIQLFIILILTVAVVIFIFSIRFRKRLFLEMEEISLIIGRMLDEKFDYQVPEYREGIKYKILWQMEQLSKSVKLSAERLIHDKENTRSLVTDISHQLKTPLASLTMCHSLLEDEDLTANEREEFLQLASHQINKLDNLIDSLVSISRMEAGMISMKPCEASINETIIQAVNTVYMKASKKNINIDLQLSEDECLPHDPKWTAEALSNILENAVKYSHINTQITLKAEPMRGYYRIEITDQGIGIDKKHYTDIYKRFYRGDQKLVKQSEGSGVGLYLTRKILEEQGASIRAQSAPERGTTFVLQLPRKAFI